MILLSNIYDANRNLWRNKLRSLLTILAIMVGSFAIIISLAIQTGTKTFLDGQFAALGGDNVISIYPKSTFDAAENLLSREIAEYSEDTNAQGIASIAKEQITKVKKISGIKASSVQPYVQYNVDYITSKETQKKYRIGVDHVTSSSFNIVLSAGNHLNNNIEENQIILPPEYVEKLGFKDARDALDQEVILAIAQPQVIETLTPDPTTISEEDQIPSTPETPETPETQFTTIPARVVGVRKTSMLDYSNGYALMNKKLTSQVKAENDKAIPEAERDKVFLLEAEHEDNADIDYIMEELKKIDLVGSTKNEMVEEVHNFLQILTIILYVFGGIALLVAAIGIINTLLMSVQERTKEIGLNKALGMSSLRIFNIFSLESILLGFWGSAIGTLVAFGAGKIADQILHREGNLLADFPDFHIVKFTILNIAIVVVIVMFIAFIAGTLPAIRAARKNPIEALRHE